MAHTRTKHRLQRPPPRDVLAMQDILAATSPTSNSLTVRNVHNSVRRALQRKVPVVLAEGMDTQETAHILGLPVRSVEAVEQQLTIGRQRPMTRIR